MCWKKQGLELAAVTLPSPAASPGLSHAPHSALCSLIVSVLVLPCPELVWSCAAWPRNADLSCQDLVCSKGGQTFPQLPLPRSAQPNLSITEQPKPFRFPLWLITEQQVGEDLKDHLLQPLLGKAGSKMALKPPPSGFAMANKIPETV